MKRIYTLITLVILAFNLNAQFTITGNQTADQLAQYLAGSGVTISNAALVCDPVASGKFNNAPSGLGITDGVVLSTGRVADIPNVSTFFASNINGTAGF